MSHLMTVGGFGLLGVFLRYGIDASAGRWFEAFPIGILSINILGSLIAGIVYVVSAEKALIPPSLSSGLLVGFCGGFTTFSTYSLQTFIYLEKTDLVRGIGYLCVSPLLGLLGVFLGVFVARVFL